MIRIILLVLAWIAPATFLRAAEPAPLFLSDAMLDITLTAPFREIDRQRDKEQEYPGTLSYLAANGQPVVLDADLKVRGNYRLRKDVCRYSQLWVDLKRGQLPGTEFAGQNRLKLVVQCRANDRYRDYVVKEYIAYRMFNQLTEPGFRARLVNVTYNYSDDEGESRTHLGLFIENKDTVAEAADAEMVELNRVGISTLEPRQATLVALYMMMIGNTDFSLTAGPEGDECCHNAKLLDVDGRYLPVPYDFDGSGFVNASYAAKPDPSFGLASNRQRQFRGYCVHNGQVQEALTRFNEVREQLYALLEDPRFDSERDRRKAIEYLDDFFAIINDPREVQSEILDECRS